MGYNAIRVIRFTAIQPQGRRNLSSSGGSAVFLNSSTELTIASTVFTDNGYVETAQSVMSECSLIFD